VGSDIYADKPQTLHGVTCIAATKGQSRGLLFLGFIDLCGTRKLSLHHLAAASSMVLGRV